MRFLPQKEIESFTEFRILTIRKRRLPSVQRPLPGGGKGGVYHVSMVRFNLLRLDKEPPKHSETDHKSLKFSNNIYVKIRKNKTLL